jgi:hypothetical protein
MEVGVMPYYWVKTKKGNRGTVVVPGDTCSYLEMEAWVKGFVYGDMPGEEVESLDILPYPANPVWCNPNKIPAFCYSPETCKGRGSCSKAPACSE